MWEHRPFSPQLVPHSPLETLQSPEAELLLGLQSDSLGKSSQSSVLLRCEKHPLVLRGPLRLPLGGCREFLSVSGR